MANEREQGGRRSFFWGLGTGLGLALCIAFAVWFFLQPGKPGVDPKSPAAELARDDGRLQADAQAALDKAKKESAAAKDKLDRIFLRVESGAHVAGESLYVSLQFSLDEPLCREYYGSLDPCEALWNSVETDDIKWQVEPDLGGSWDADWYWYHTLTYSFPIDRLPDVPSLRFRLPENGMGKVAVVVKPTVDVKVPGWGLTLSGEQVQIDPAKPETLIARFILDGKLPVAAEGRKNIEDQLAVVVSAGDAKVGAPLFTWDPLHMSCVVTVPVLRLGAAVSTLTVTLPAGIARAKGWAGSAEALETKTQLPEAKKFAQVERVTATTVTEGDVIRQALIVRFNVPVKTAEAASFVRGTLLPLYAGKAEEQAKHPTNWLTEQTVTPEAVASGETLSLTLAPGFAEKEFAEELLFYYEMDGKRFLHVTGTEGISTATGYAVTKGWEETVQLFPIAPELFFMQTGNILSLNGSRKLALSARGMDHLDWRLWQVKPEFINLLVSQSYHIESWNPYFYSYGGLGFVDMSDAASGKIPLTGSLGARAQYASLDLSSFLAEGKRGIFQLSVAGMKNGIKQREETRFILITDLGLLLKQERSGGFALFVSSFSKGGPVAGAEVRVLGKNGGTLMTRTSDAAGYVSLPPLDGFTAEKAPVALEVHKDGDYTFLPLTNVQREQAAPVHGTDLQAVVFSERGIYRPGEPLYFGFAVKTGNWQNKLLEGMPVEVMVRNSRDEVIFRQKITLNAHGLAEVSVPTKEVSPTGTYSASLLINGRYMGGTEVQVQEFEPDRLKVVSRLNGFAPGEIKGWLRPEKITAETTVENLYGTPAVGHEVRANLQIIPARLSFAGYRDYSFYSPDAEAKGVFEELTPQETDEHGKVSHSLGLEKYEPGSYRIVYEGEGFEAGGGRSVLSRIWALVSSHDYFIGWKSAADVGFLAKGAPAELQFIALGQEGAPVRSASLTLTIEELRYVSTLVRDDRGNYKYERVKQKHPVSSQEVVIPTEGLVVPLPTGAPGSFQCTLKEGVSVRSVVPFTVAGTSKRSVSGVQDAAIELKLDKKEYTAGETIRLFLRVPYAGSGLITLESEKVLSHQWFTASSADFVVDVPVPDDFEGAGNLVVTMSRDFSSSAIHKDPMAQASVPFVANVKKRDMQLTIDVPEKTLPGEPLVMRIQATKPGKALVFAVDEGVLQLTRYQTPSLVQFFLRQGRSLLPTQQNLDRLMPEFGLVRGSSAFGGDLTEDLASRLNPFRRKSEPSVVYWSGIVDVSESGTELSWTVPSYFNGALRVMAVASGEEGVGDASSQVIARSPVIINPALPVAVSPGDEFDAVVSLGNNMEADEPALIRLQVDLEDGLAFVNPPETEILVPKFREGKITFRLKATDKLGECVVGLTASAGGVTVARPVALSVRPSSPKVRMLAAGRTSSDSQTIPVARDLYAEHSVVEASVSGLPLPVMDALAKYLAEFPYDCTEQLISAALPYTVYRNTPELFSPRTGESALQQQKKEFAAVQKAFLALSEREVRRGQFALWPRQGYVYSFLSVYACDFLLNAKDAGFAVPENLLESTGARLREILQLRPDNVEDLRLVAYAAWVSGRMNTPFVDLPKLIAHSDERIPGWRKDAAASLLAGAMRMMFLHKEAENLIAEVDVLAAPKAGQTNSSWFMSPLWQKSMHLTLLALHFPEKLQEESTSRLLAAIVNETAEGRYSTVGAAQAVRGLAAFAVHAAKDKSHFSLTGLDAEGKPLSLAVTGESVKRIIGDHSLYCIGVTGGKGLYWQISSSGFDRVLPKEAAGQKMELGIQYVPVGGKPIGEFAQGDEMWVILRAKATTEEVIDNVIISSLIPGGFEMVLDTAALTVEENYGYRYYDEELHTAREEEGWRPGRTVAYPDEKRKREQRSKLEEAGVAAPPMDVTYAERREDRMLIFTSLDREDRYFVYRIKAVNKGEFTLPAAMAEGLYDRDVFARSTAGRVHVE